MVKVCIDLFPPTSENEVGGFYLDGTETRELENVKKIVTNSDTDFVVGFCGDVGSGKSTKCAQVMKYFDSTFCSERMCQNEKQFREQLEKIKSKQAIVLDEAFEGLNSAQTASRAQRLLVNLLQIVRQRNLFIGIVLPNFFDLNKTTAIFRLKWLYRTYSSKGRKGFFEIWGKDRKRELYIKGKKLFDYRCVKPNLKGRFTKFFPIDKEIYTKMKYDNFLEMASREETPAGKERSATKTQRDNAIKTLSKEGKTHTELCSLFGLSPSSIAKIISGDR